MPYSCHLRYLAQQLVAVTSKESAIRIVSAFIRERRPGDFRNLADQAGTRTATQALAANNVQGCQAGNLF